MLPALRMFQRDGKGPHRKNLRIARRFQAGAALFAVLLLIAGCATRNGAAAGGASTGVAPSAAVAASTASASFTGLKFPLAAAPDLGRYRTGIPDPRALQLKVPAKAPGGSGAEAASAASPSPSPRARAIPS